MQTLNQLPFVYEPQFIKTPTKKIAWTGSRITLLQQMLKSHLGIGGFNDACDRIMDILYTLRWWAGGHPDKIHCHSNLSGVGI